MGKDLDFTGKNVLVTGGSNNIGKRIAECFLETGANVIFTFHGNEARAQATYEELSPKAKGVFTYLKADAGNVDDVERTFDFCREKFGGTVDFLINNAALMDLTSGNHGGEKLETIERSTPEEFDAQMFGTLSPVFYHTRRFVNDCIAEGKGGRIVNISSKAAYSTKSGILAYAAAKAGISMLTNVMGMELGKYDIIATGILPGFVSDDLALNNTGAFTNFVRNDNVGPLGRVAAGRDMGEMAVQLCGPAGTFAIGTDIDLTGGRLLQ